jgi:hypothetical protein
MPNLVRVPVLTPRRIWAAFIVAILIDTLQLVLGPLGWAFLDQGLDLIAMLLTIALVGFHPLLLPSFLLELLPVADMLPTWTACVALVVALRRRQAQAPTVPSIRTSGPVIDI